jgi:hypothetical protein
MEDYYIINFQLQCKQCSESLDLGKFLKKETRRYVELHGFLRKHVTHELICQETIREPEIRQISGPEPAIDISTPEKKEAWLRATKLLLDAVMRAEERERSKGGDTSPLSE